MERVTFFESIIKIIKTISSIPLFIEILILTLFLLMIMIFFYFRKSKSGRITCIIIYCVSLCLLPLTHFDFFISTIDKIVEDYMKILYFPSCYVYIAMLVITDVTLLVAMIKDIKEENKTWNMIIDLIYFSVFQFLFFMIVRLVVTNNIDIFQRAALYSNVNLTSCIQVSSYLFWIRVGIIFLNKLINRLSSASSKMEVKVKTVPKMSNFATAKRNNNVNKKMNTKTGSSINMNANTSVNKEYNDSNELIKKLLGQDYFVDSNSNVNSIKGNKTITNNDKKRTENKKVIISNKESTKDDYFYDDFYE